MNIFGYIKRKLKEISGEGIVYESNHSMHSNTKKVSIIVHAIRIPSNMTGRCSEYTDYAFSKVSPFGTKDQIISTLV